MSLARSILLDGDALAQRIRQELAHRVADLRARNITPHLATVLVGDNPASEAYIGRKHVDCQQLGIETLDIRLPSDLPQSALSARIAELNQDRAIHGFLVQLPLPHGLDQAQAIAEVDPDKDIDGLHPINLGQLLAGEPGLLPCTPAAVLTLLQHHDVPLAGRHMVIIGRGALVGRPLAMLASMRGIDATVTLAHSATSDLAKLTRSADIVISAAGVPNLVTAAMIKPGAAVVGVGITYGADGTIVSDLAHDVAETAGWLTPRHGSVGALTRARLLHNLLEIAERRPIEALQVDGGETSLDK